MKFVIRCSHMKLIEFLKIDPLTHSCVSFL